MILDYFLFEKKLKYKIFDYVISFVCWRRKVFWAAKTQIAHILLVKYN